MSQEIKNIKLGIFVLTITRRYDDFKMSLASPDIKSHYLSDSETMPQAEKAAIERIIELLEPAYFAALAWRNDQ